MAAFDGEPPSSLARFVDPAIAVLCVVAIFVHLGLRFGGGEAWGSIPLFVAMGLGGLPVVWKLLQRLIRFEFGSDLIAGVSIVTSVLLEEYLAGTIVVLMVSGGETIESYAVQSASSVLRALARRMPSNAHRRVAGQVSDVALDDIAIDDVLVLFPHEICPADGVVLEGHGVMDESFLTGEPYQMSKTPGTEVISGALNGESAITFRATRRPVDSRYAQIMRVMAISQQTRPRMRRLADQLGAWYTPLALAIGVVAWFLTGSWHRFLAVIITATPCPLLIAIPVAIIGAISLSARRGIIIKNPAVLEQAGLCQTIIFDKTGTLTYGQPRLTEELAAPGFAAPEVLSLVASVERYSKHPLATAIQRRASDSGVSLSEASQISEPPGQGLTGFVNGRAVQITSRNQLAESHRDAVALLPPIASGLECVVLVDDKYAATYRFRDEPRVDGQSFIGHLSPRHQVRRVLIVSGDRESEVRYLAERVGVKEIYSQQSPEDKLNLVRREMTLAPTLFVGDGINDAPALATATVGLAFGSASDITSEAAGAVILENSLGKIDEFLHISRRMRTIALQSALGGIAVSLLGMVLAALGYVPPVGGAILQEVIDLIAVLNAVRVAWPPALLTDFSEVTV
ncbi:MAG: heavy metal translocating P-type ATPase [Planctomycetales bacterium]|nr:heavy metal translocating P-type ATPase [Planctomycetales bacterium]